ncbi:hypothetical protein BHM03_00006929 [Ensete ventricosum]|nr:hypothetical protein BHM03_00006929 [Ensete ventricosum]
MGRSTPWPRSRPTTPTRTVGLSSTARSVSISRQFDSVDSSFGLLFLVFVISVQVYDVTKFLEDHPGGDDVLLSSTGRSISGYPDLHTASLIHQ